LILNIAIFVSALIAAFMIGDSKGWSDGFNSARKIYKREEEI